MLTPDQISKLPPELRKAAKLCTQIDSYLWGAETISKFHDEAFTALPLALTWALQVQERAEQLRFKLFHYAEHKGTSHTTACSIWREDGQGHADGFEGGRGPCNCGALENFERERAEKVCPNPTGPWTNGGHDWNLWEDNTHHCHGCQSIRESSWQQRAEKAEAESENLREQVNCGGVRTGWKCISSAEPGHEIFGCAYGSPEAGFTCELHYFRDQLETAEAKLLQVVEERDDTQAKLTKARLGMEWRDDVISSFCDSINDKRLAEKRDEIQWREFDKANDFWEKEERGLELSPYKEQFLIQTDSYEQLENSIHGELDKLGVPRSGGSVIRIRDLHKRADTAEATIATLTRERDKAREQRDYFLRDGSRPLDVLAREIVETLRPTDAPGSSEYSVVWVGSKLKSISAALSHTPEGGKL